MCREIRLQDYLHGISPYFRRGERSTVCWCEPEAEQEDGRRYLPYFGTPAFLKAVLDFNFLPSSSSSSFSFSILKTTKYRRKTRKKYANSHSMQYTISLFFFFHSEGSLIPFMNLPRNNKRKKFQHRKMWTLFCLICRQSHMIWLF